MAVDASVLNDVAAFDEEFTPESARKFASVSDLPEGVFDFVIADVDLGRTEKSGEAILKLKLRLGTNPLLYDHAYFFRQQKSVNALGADLIALGFPLAQGVAFSQQLASLLPKLKGVAFRGQRQDREDSFDNTKVYHNLIILQRLSPGGAAPAQTAPAPRGPKEPVPF